MSQVGPPLDGGRVLVTGASAGLGSEFARQLAPRAAVLILVARRRERLEELQGELGAQHPSLEVDVEPCDLGDPAAVDALCARVLERRGGVDVLINNAGLGDLALYEQAEWRRIEQIIRVNVAAPALLTHRFLPGMVERGRAGILNVGSGAGFNIMPGSAVYAGSKHFVNGWTESLRAELEGTGVIVSQVAPGPVETEFDDAAGVPEGGLMGGADAFMKISAERCVTETIARFERGEALIFPGRNFRFAMAAQAMAPRAVRRRMARGLAAKLRRRVPPGATDPWLYQA